MAIELTLHSKSGDITFMMVTKISMIAVALTASVPGCTCDHASNSQASKNPLRVSASLHHVCTSFALRACCMCIQLQSADMQNANMQSPNMQVL